MPRPETALQAAVRMSVEEAGDALLGNDATYMDDMLNIALKHFRIKYEA